MKLNLALYKRAILTDSRKFVLYGAWIVMGAWLFIQLHSYVSVMNAMRSFRGAANLNGLQFLQTLAYVNFFFLTVAGILGFSSSITEEKEEDCLGLLIMTGITPLNLLASKTLARFSRGFFLLLSQIPFVIMAVTLGGVSLQQVIATYSVLLSYMFVLCCIGTFFSLLFTTTSRAASVTFLFLLFYIVLLLFAKEVEILEWDEMSSFLPFIAMNQIFSTGYGEYYIPGQFYGSIVVGVIFFGMSIYFFDSFALREPAEKKKKNNSTFLKRGRTWANALFWKEFNFNLSGRKGWVIQSVLYVILASVIAYYSRPYNGDEFIVGFMAFAGLVFSTLILAVSASNMFSSEFKEGTHTSLFTLPVDLSSIFWSKLLGAFLYAVPSLALTVFLFFYLFSSAGSPPDIEPILITLSFILVYIVLSGYLGLIMRIGSFVASAAILFISWIAIGAIVFRNMDENSAVFLSIFVNGMASVVLFIMGKKKLESMICR